MSSTTNPTTGAGPDPSATNADSPSYTLMMQSFDAFNNACDSRVAGNSQSPAVSTIDPSCLTNTSQVSQDLLGSDAQLLFPELQPMINTEDLFKDLPLSFFETDFGTGFDETLQLMQQSNSEATASDCLQPSGQGFAYPEPQSQQGVSSTPYYGIPVATGAEVDVHQPLAAPPAVMHPSHLNQMGQSDPRLLLPRLNIPTAGVLQVKPMYAPERPVPGNPNIINIPGPQMRRVNATTGPNTRTGKINQYIPMEHYDLIPMQNRTWRSGQHEFQYNFNGALAGGPYTADKLQAFMLNRPQHLPSLTMWLQKAPADSGRRHMLGDGGVCLCAECPLRNLKQASIRVGSVGVAFDEWTAMYPDMRLDPFQVSGYVHLYCLERFFDFPAIVACCDVRVDSRQFPSEPHGVFAGTYAGHPEGEVAEMFLQSVRAGHTPSRYPSRELFAREFGSHVNTLTYLMNKMKEAARKNATAHALRKRDLSGSQSHIHLGDLEVYLFGTCGRFGRTLKPMEQAYLNRALHPWQVSNDFQSALNMIEEQGNEYDVVHHQAVRHQARPTKQKKRSADEAEIEQPKRSKPYKKSKAIGPQEYLKSRSDENEVIYDNITVARAPSPTVTLPPQPAPLRRSARNAKSAVYVEDSDEEMERLLAEELEK